jgi:hypothetical protein
MFRRKGIIGIFLVISVVLFGFGLPKNVQKKLTKEVQKAFEIESFQVDGVTVSPTCKTSNENYGR